jgi:hypothetical protein
MTEDKIMDAIRDYREPFGIGVDEQKAAKDIMTMHEKHKIIFAEQLLMKVKDYADRSYLKDVSFLVDNIITEMVNNSNITADEFANDTI